MTDLAATELPSPEAAPTGVRLTTAQRSLWVAQQLLGDLPIAIAQSVRLRGPLDVDTLVESIQQACRELVVTAGPVAATADGPRLLLEHTGFPVDRIDLRGNADPEVAADISIRDACGAPLRLDRDNLLVIALLRVADSEWILFARAHHILLDGYGTLAVMRRAVAVHRGIADDPPSPTALARADAAYRASSRFLSDRDHWRRRFDELPEPIHLGTVRAAASSTPISSRATVDGALTAAVRRCAASMSTHDSVILIAAIGAYVARIADRDGVALSLAVPARTTAATRTAAGSISNLVPVTIAAPAGISLRDFVASVGTELSGALRHQQYRHEDMLRDSGTAVTSLHQFGPVLNVFPARPALELDAVTGHHEVISTGPVLDLNINVYPTADADTQRIDIEANPNAFAADTVRTLHAGLLSFIEQFVRLDLDDLIGRIPMETSAAQRDSRSLPPPATLGELLRLSPDDGATAVIDGRSRLSYRELRQRAAALADQLRRAGAEPETAVATVLARSVDSVVAAWAIALSGACYVPIDPRYPPERIGTIVGASGCRLGIAHTPPGGGETVRWISPDAAGAASGLRSTGSAAVPDHAAYQIFTSGSTGTPKGVVVTGRGLSALATEIRDGYALETSSVLAHFASPSFDTSIVEILAAGITGATLAIIPPDITGGAELADALESRGVTHLFITPSALATLPHTKMPALTSILVGGEACPPALAQRWIASGRRLRCAYGPTETTCSVTVTGPLRDDDVQLRVPIGSAMPAVATLVLDHRLRPQPVGAVGELFIAGPSLARGYQQGALTSARFVANPWGAPGSRMYRTGDLVSKRTDGNLDFCGRSDDQLKLRGFRVEPGEIDSTLRRIAGVENAVTIAVRRGDSPTLASYVTGHRLDPSRLRTELLKMLPAFLIPSTITVLEQLPTAATGKVDLARLPAPDAIAAVAYRSPSTELEKACCDAFSEVTGTVAVGVDHDFFAIGGDSLSATQLVARVNDTTGSCLTVRDVIESRSPAALAAAILADERPSLVAGPALATPLTPAQRNIDLDDRGPAHVIPFAIRLPDIDTDALDAAINDVAATHQLLRATIDDGLVHPDTADPIELRQFAGSATAFTHQGFDLTREPPVRIGFQQRADHVLVAVALHHASIDGRSMTILAGQLAVAYAARCSGSEPGIPAPGIDYLDYARWIATWLGDPDDPASRHSAQIDYWRGELSGLPTAFATPSTRPRPPQWDRHGARRRYTIDHSMWSALHASAQRCGTTTFAVARASIARHLCAAAGARDIVIGTPVGGRGRSEFDGMVGMFVNTLPLRYRVEPGDSLDRVVTGHIDTEVRAHRFGDVAYADVASGLGHDDRHVHPLFQVVVSTDAAPEFPALGMQPVQIEPLPPALAKCDLHFSITPPRHDAPATLDVLYPTAMFDEDDIDRLAMQWRRSMEGN